MSKAEESRKYRAKFPERKSAENRKWWAANRDKKKQYRRNRKALERGAVGNHTQDDVIAIMRLQKQKCAYCRMALGDKYQVDHIVPLSGGGSNRRSNIQVTCVGCNIRKKARDPVEFAQSLGRLI